MKPEDTEQVSFALGVDVGSAYIAAAVVDLETGRIVPGTVRQAPVNAQGTLLEILDAWCGTLLDVMQLSPVPVNYFGIAMPGPFDYDSGVSHIRYLNKFDALYGINVKQLLAQRFGFPTTHIKMRNEAEAFLAGEVMCGAARGIASVVGIKLGTGLGSARSHLGRTEDAHLGSSLFLDGIAEDYLTTRWFAKRSGFSGADPVKGIEDLIARWPDDPAIQRLFHVYSHNLAHFLGGVIQSGKPGAIILGGCIARAYDIFYPQINRLLEKHLDKVVIRRAELGEDAPLIGAASLWMKKARPSAALV